MRIYKQEDTWLPTLYHKESKNKVIAAVRRGLDKEDVKKNSLDSWGMRGFT